MIREDKKFKQFQDLYEGMEEPIKETIVECPHCKKEVTLIECDDKSIVPFVEAEWKGPLPEGWTSDSVEKFAKSLTKKAKGEEGIFTACMAKMKDVAGIKDPAKFCGALKARYLEGEEPEGEMISETGK